MIQNTIQALFEAHAKKNPNQLALVFEDQSLTYRELNEQANQCAHYLREQGITPDSPVALCMARSIELLIVMLGVLKAGGAYVPLDASHPTARLFFVLNDNKNPLLIIDPELEKKFNRYQGPLLNLKDLEATRTNYPKHNPKSSTETQHLAYIIYTSGSTGKPKGVLIEHHSVVNYSHWFAKYSACKPKERIDFSSNYIFDMAVTSSIVALMQGLTVVITPDIKKEDTTLYLKQLNAHKITIIKITPSYFKALLHEVKNNFVELPHLKSIILGGENLTTMDCESWLNYYPKHTLYNEYGPTEATVAVSHYKVSTKNLRTLGGYVPIGKPAPTVDFHILTAEKTPVVPGEVGELYLGGNCLARSYLNQTSLTQEQFITNPFKSGARLYKTGDLCRRHPNGVIECLGRADYQLKIRGFRVEPSEIERCLMSHNAVMDAVVLPQKNKHHEKQLIAYYILKEASFQPKVKQLRHYLETHLPYYMVPSAFIQVDTFPRNASGKLDKDALPIPQFVTNQHYKAPKTDLEKKLTQIWAQELDLKLVGIEDDFFELGGYSLSAARVISSIRSQLNKDLSLQDFYKTGTIKQLIQVLETTVKNDESDTPTVQTAQTKEAVLLPLSDFQLLIWLCNNFEPNAQKLNIVIRKRVQGRFNSVSLNAALEAIFKKHEVLFYRILRFRPAQRIQTIHPFIINETHLESLTVLEYEPLLNDSFDELLYYYPWPKKAPLLLARLFHLDEDIDELQISMSHLVSDYISSEILLADLSTYYLAHLNQQAKPSISLNKSYKEYILNEQHYFKTQLNQDILFWEDYLKTTALVAFPTMHVIKNMESRKLPYSTYVPLNEEGLNKLQQFCAEHYVSINDGLTASLLLALLACCTNDQSYLNNIAQPIFISMVKSTRDDQNYDKTIGCFLRVESIKIALTRNTSLVELAKQIHQACIDTAPYQQCASLVKIACVSTFYQKAKRLKSYLINSFTFFYAKLLRALSLNRKILNLCGRLAVYERDNHFIININIQPNLLANTQRRNKTNLFGLATETIPKHHCDLLKASNVFDVCFLRDEHQNTPYLVISANLAPAFREQIAKEVIHIMGSGKQDKSRKSTLEKV